MLALQHCSGYWSDGVCSGASLDSSLNTSVTCTHFSGKTLFIHVVNLGKNGAKINAVLRLNIRFNTAFPTIGSLIHRNVCTNRMYCQKNIIPIVHKTRLKITCPKANCLLTIAHHIEANTPVKVVQIFAHITIAIEAGNQIIFEFKAASVKTQTALLDCNMIVIIIHITKYIGRLRSANAVKSKLCCSISTLSFIKSNPRNSNPNPMNSFARLLHFLSLANMIISPPIVIIGNAKAEILNAPNPNRDTNNHVNVVQMFAHINNPKAFCSCMTPAPTKAIEIRVTRLLLCNKAVTAVPTDMDFNELSV